MTNVTTHVHVTTACHKCMSQEVHVTAGALCTWGTVLKNMLYEFVYNSYPSPLVPHRAPPDARHLRRCQDGRGHHRMQRQPG